MRVRRRLAKGAETLVQSRLRRRELRTQFKRSLVRFNRLFMASLGCQISPAIVQHVHIRRQYLEHYHVVIVEANCPVSQTPGHELGITRLPKLSNIGYLEDQTLWNELIRGGK